MELDNESCSEGTTLPLQQCDDVCKDPEPMAPRVISRVLVYPVILLCGMAIAQPVSLSLGGTGGGTAPPVKDVPLTQLEARLGAESSELRSLRMAEEQLFPEFSAGGVKTAGNSVASAAHWDWYQPPAAAQAMRRLRFDPAANFLAGLEEPGIPIRRHRRVAKYVQYFSQDVQGRRLFTTWLKRSGQYRSMVGHALRERGLPTDLEAVPFIESGWWPTAKSTAGAMGLWQFMPKTARVYGLEVDGNYDERRSAWLSTEAAAEHLEDLHQRFHSWDLALAAYNYGYDRLLARMGEMGTEDFWVLSEVDGALPRETALYVPKILAVAVLLKNLDHFGFGDVELAPPLRTAEIRVPPGIRLSMLARASGTSERAIRELNPHIREDVIPDRGEPCSIRIPSRGLAQARAMLPRMLEDEGEEPFDLMASVDFDWGRDELKKDGLGRLERTGTTKRDWDDGDPGALQVEELDKAPDDPGPKTSHRSRGNAKSKLGTTARKPTSASTASSSEAEPAPEAKAKTKPPTTKVRHQIEEGDTIWRLSEVYDVPRYKIVRDNRLKNPDVLTVGRSLVLNVPSPAASDPKAAPTPKE